LIDNGYGLYIVGINQYIVNNNISINTVGLNLQVYNSQITDNYISYNKQYGIYTVGYDSIFARNNFIDNPINAYFKNLGLLLYIFSQRNKNIWDANYWDDYRGGKIYLIFGRTYFLLGKFSFTWFNIDWHPALEPYDIEI
jgi:hypothetical protein